MAGDRFGQTLDVITTFKTTDDSAIAVRFSNLYDKRCQRLEVFRFKAERTDRVLSVCVESRADEHHFRPTPGSRIGQERFKPGQIFLARCPERNRQVEFCSEPLSGTGFILLAGSRIKRRSMG